MGVNYRRVATPEQAKMLEEAARLADKIEPNWQFDPDTGGFYVIVNKERFDIEFGADDVETEFVRFVSRNFQALVAAARGRLLTLD